MTITVDSDKINTQDPLYLYASSELNTDFLAGHPELEEVSPIWAWECDNVDIVLSNTDILLSEPDSSTLIIKDNVLTPGLSYEFEVKATYPDTGVELTLITLINLE